MSPAAQPAKGAPQSLIRAAALPAALPRPHRAGRPVPGARRRRDAGLFPIALRTLIDQGLADSGHGERLVALREHFLELFAVAVALGLFSAARFYMVSWLGERVTADLRSAVYAHVVGQSPEFFETTQTGEVLSRLTTDTTLVQTVVGSSFSMGLRNLVMGVGALGMLVWTHPYVMALVLAAVLLVVLPAMTFGRRVRKLSRASQDRIADSSAIAAEVLNAIPVVQSYTGEAREAARFSHATDDAFRTGVRRTKARAVLVAFIIIANAALLLWGLYRGAQAVTAGEMTAGQLGQAALYVIIFAGAVAVLGEVYGDLLRAAGATERLMELLSSSSPVVSPAAPVTTPAPTAGSAVRFENVGFHYPSRPRTPALQDFTLAIAPGETVALVGPSGAGKSTVFSLLLRFYDPAQGRIVVDGVPVRDRSLHDLRSRHRPGARRSRWCSRPARWRTSATAARAPPTTKSCRPRARPTPHEFIDALPEGYGTFLGERGVRLSGGQRQRIAIARAILKNPPLLLLDEATSALDAESERMVQAALASAMRDRTTLVIAHRLATVQQADRIVVLDHGRIVEQGRHEQLVAAGGVYARLAALQLLE